MQDLAAFFAADDEGRDAWLQGFKQEMEGAILMALPDGERMEAVQDAYADMVFFLNALAHVDTHRQKGTLYQPCPMIRALAMGSEAGRLFFHALVVSGHIERALNRPGEEDEELDASDIVAAAEAWLKRGDAEAG